MGSHRSASGRFVSRLTYRALLFIGIGLLLACLGMVVLREKKGRAMASFSPPVAAAAVSAAGRYTITDLGTLPGGSSSSARAINGAGWVVGEADRLGEVHAFIYSSKATGLLGLSAPGMIDLGTLGGKKSFALAID